MYFFKPEREEGVDLTSSDTEVLNAQAWPKTILWYLPRFLRNSDFRGCHCYRFPLHCIPPPRFFYIAVRGFTSCPRHKYCPTPPISPISLIPLLSCFLHSFLLLLSFRPTWRGTQWRTSSSPSAASSSATPGREFTWIGHGCPPPWDLTVGFASERLET